MKTVGIVAGSNGQKEEYRSQNDELFAYLLSTGRKVIFGNGIYEKNGPFSGTEEIPRRSGSGSGSGSQIDKE